ncbi:MAG TPA: ATP-binding protein [Aquabacterium sp.]|uniref:ATP-binding protein n=1 Tax=Aquabacterium sp. TaxID=1872578 RepID=UPI002E2F0254|nr:ATP-binding protein [Aquabacterium sp.]HEX5355463.1 ATP-binding protein [Aquabacterium sp.]
MKLQLDRPDVLALTDRFPELDGLQTQLRFGHRIELRSRSLPLEALEFLARLYEEAGAALAGRAAQLRALVAAQRCETQRFKQGDSLEAVLPALVRYLAEGTERGWLFAANMDGKPLAWVPTRIDYVQGSSEELGKVMVELKAHARANLISQSLRITEGDLPGHTIAEILAAKGLLKETPALLAAYDASAARYFEWRGRYGTQFSGEGMGFIAEDPTATHRDTDWSRKDQVVLSASGGAARLVNDEGILPPRGVGLESPGDILGPYLRRAAKSSDFDYEEEVKALDASLPAHLFKALPVQAYLFLFHLELHQHLWVHADDVELYLYQPELKHKLVLPSEQTELIDILTAEMDVLQEDVIAGKSGGTTVLCAGPPGVGKTLTAEVYAEVTGRPLYRVHSGQLGLSVSAMESALKEALTRAQRWGAVMLIDEADVYIRKRSDDITANAVVGVFLRVLEYFDGLLFLTTNRIDDIDEAIVSRCIALIRYHAPDRAARERIWGVMAEQFNLDLDAAMVRQLAEIYPEASGRDIKGLSKLVAKFCQHKQLQPTLDVFARCAMFRALDPVVDADKVEA